MIVKAFLNKYTGTNLAVVLNLLGTDGELINIGGDTMLEVDNGLFSATVTESLPAPYYSAEILVGGVLRYQGWLVPGTSSLIDDPLIGSGAADVDLIASQLISALTGSEISITSPQIDARGRLDPLLRGCDYSVADGNAIRITCTTVADLTNAEIAFTAAAAGFTIAGTGTATQDEDVATKWHLVIELTKEETNKPPDDYGFAITALLTSGRRIGLRAGTLPLRDDFLPGEEET